MPTVLVVDDSEIMREKICTDLISAGYSVIEADNGEVGLEQVANNVVDLVITDFNMPKMDGLSMCARLNPTSAEKKLPIFMLTTQYRPDLKQEAKEYGVIAWIIKPYNKEGLIKAANKVCPVS